MSVHHAPPPRPLPIADRWSLHGYYSLCPYAPDGSDRLLVAGADLATDTAEVLVLGPDRSIQHRFGRVPVTPSFWHTGLWQSWSPDSRSVYYQSGSHQHPRTTRHDLDTGQETTIDGDMEGFPPSGEPAFSCSHSLLYAAGYGSGLYRPEAAPVPFQARDRHGISLVSFDPPGEHLALSTQQILDTHPDRDRILAADREIKARLGPDDGLTLMTYCVRWNRAGTRCLFFFGNHCVVKDRGEPKITSIFTADRDLKKIQLALDISFDRRGVHWSWQADDEHLIGYGPDPDRPGQQCLAEVRHDGTGYRKLSDHASGGHPSTSPPDPNLIVTDEGTPTGGAVVFIDRRDGREVSRVALPKFHGDHEPPGRNPRRICHHPVFNRAGDRVLCNTLPGTHAELVEIIPPSLP